MHHSGGGWAESAARQRETLFLECIECFRAADLRGSDTNCRSALGIILQGDFTEKKNAEMTKEAR